MTPTLARTARRILRLMAAMAALALLHGAPSHRALATTECFDATRDSLSRSAAADSCWYTLHVHAVRVSDSCAGARTAAIDPEQVARWIEKANEVYAAARVRFEFDPTPDRGDWAEIHDTELNRLTAELPGDAVWEHGKSAANELASHFPRKILVLFRHGPDPAPTGGGFSSNAYNFVVMPGFDVTTICGPTQNAYLLAHEMGHYFGLKHTFRQFKTKAEAAAALKSAANKPAAFDADGLSETPPEPYIEDLQCGNDALVVLNGIPFPLVRSNVMSYYASAVKTLSREQAAIVRTWVARRFTNAMDGVGPFVPDGRLKYQIFSLAGGKALEVERASKASGAKIRPSEWSGASNQSWKVVPLTAGDAGWFEIVSVSSGLCLTAEGGGPNDGTRIVQREWEGRSGQKWRFNQDDHGDLAIEARHVRKVLNVAAGAGATRASGGFVELSDDKGITGQRWRLLPAE